MLFFFASLYVFYKVKENGCGNERAWSDLNAREIFTTNSKQLQRYSDLKNPNNTRDNPSNLVEIRDRTSDSDSDVRSQTIEKYMEEVGFREARLGK